MEHSVAVECVCETMLCEKYRVPNGLCQAGCNEEKHRWGLGGNQVTDVLTEGLRF